MAEGNPVIISSGPCWATACVPQAWREAEIVAFVAEALSCPNPAWHVVTVESDTYHHALRHGHPLRRMCVDHPDHDEVMAHL